MNYYTNHLLWFVCFGQNWLYVFNPPPNNSILLHLWSLAVEEQFYLFWPFIVLLIRERFKLLLFTLALLICLMVLRPILWSLHVENLAYDSLYTFTRIDGICIGSAIAILYRVNPTLLKNHTPTIVAGLAALNFVMYFLNKNASTRLPYLAFVGYTTFAVMFGLLLYELISGKSELINSVFNNKPLLFFGRISYGLYVYHWPIYSTLFPLLKSSFSKYISNQNAVLFVASILCTLIAILISYYSYEYFEKYFLRLKKHFT
jgi:peptidoglycan/LPS O-acetylase OafA/YrhL